jgi:hypothetical protein
VRGTNTIESESCSESGRHMSFVCRKLNCSICLVVLCVVYGHVNTWFGVV